MKYINADDRDVWLQVGMAIKDEFGDGGRYLWDEWSRQSAKFVERDQEQSWRSFRRSGIGLGTLFHHAQQAGWQDSRRDKKEYAKPEKQAPREDARADDDGHSWDSPDWSILDDRRGQLPDFPLKVFNEKTRAMVEPQL